MLGGFSDGASYALTLGITNGELLRHSVAFSPGFAAPPAQEGSPRIFLCHGTQDTVLPIDRCSRRLNAALTQARRTARDRPVFEAADPGVFQEG